MVRFLFITFFVISSVTSFSVVAKTLTNVSLNDETYLIIDVSLHSDIEIISGVEVFIHEGEYMLPIFAITNALKLNSSIDIDKSDFFLEFKGKETLINFKTNELSSPVTFNNREVFWGENGFDIYVSANFIEQLIEAKIDTEISNLIFNISPLSESLLYPIEVELQRETKKSDYILKNNKSKTVDLKQVFIEDQYRLIMPPQIYTRIRYDKYTDVSEQTTDDLLASPDIEQADDEFEENISASVTGTSDIFYHSANYSINWQDDEKLNSTIRFSKYKTSPYDVLPGNVDYYAFGDVSSYASSLTKKNSGVGLTFSQKENRYSLEFGKTTIDGIAPPGWQAELYDGGFFVGETIVNDDGQYIFDDVNTRYGINQYRIVLYGPFGEVETRYETVRIGSNWLNAGEISYRGAFFDSNRKLLDSDQYDQYGFDYDVDTLNFGFDYGINDSVQWQLMYYQDETSLEETQRYLSSQVQINFDSNAIVFGVAGKEDAGYATEMSWLGNLNNSDTFGVNFQYADNYDLIFGVNDNSILLGSASYHSRFDSLDNSMLDLYTRYAKVEQQYESGIHSGRFSWNMFGLNFKFDVTNTNFSFINANTSGISTTQVSMSASGPVNDGRLTMSLAKQLENDDYQEYSVSYQNNFEQLFLYSSARYINVGLDDSQWESNVQLAYRPPQLLLTSGVSYNSKSKWRLTLGVDFAFGYDYQREQFDFSSKYNQSAQLDIGAYLDRNNNYILDKGDYALEGAQFGPFKSWSDLPTLKNGRTLLTPVPVKSLVNLDAKWRDIVRPSQGKHTIYTHPGGLISANIPFTITTSMAGYVLFDDGNELIGANGIRVNLIDAIEGEEVDSVIADEDGFFEFYNKKAGHYFIEIDINDVSKRGLTVSHRRFNLKTPPRGGYVELDAFVLNSGTEQNDKTMLVELNDDNYEPLFSGGKNDEEIYVNVFSAEEAAESNLIFNSKFKKINAGAIKSTRIKLTPDVPITDVVPNLDVNSGNNDVTSEIASDVIDNSLGTQTTVAEGTNNIQVSANAIASPELVNAEAKFTRLEWRYGAQIAVFSSEASAEKYIESLDVKGIPIKAYFDEDNKLYRLILGDLTKNLNEVEASIGRYKPILTGTDMFAKYFRVLIDY